MGHQASKGDNGVSDWVQWRAPGTRQQVFPGTPDRYGTPNETAKAACRLPADGHRKVNRLTIRDTE